MLVELVYIFIKVFLGKVLHFPFIVLFIDGESVFIAIINKRLHTHNFEYLDKLVFIALSFEKGFLVEHHACHHTASLPNIEGIRVIIIACEKFRSFIIS